MPRVKRGIIALKKRRKILKLAKGYRGTRRKLMRAAREAVIHALDYSYRDRRTKKRNFRALWITRINAASRKLGLTYNNFISGLKKSGVQVNRKILSTLANTDFQTFTEYANLAKKQLSLK
ncbi:MAG: 50S ribosomal protein L20 [Armatimonadetes bacterium]|nr:50S ribosomal protein L20 [Armatimonadota bacterium]